MQKIVWVDGDPEVIETGIPQLINNIRKELVYYKVSTVELPCTHVGGDFETMVFVEGDDDNQWDEWQCRYPTFGDAVSGHRTVTEGITEGATPEEVQARIASGGNKCLTTGEQ